MKKFISLFMVGFLLFSCSEEDTKETDWENNKLNGKFKSITEIKYDAVEKFGEFQKGSLGHKLISKYDKSGNLTEWTKYRSNESIDSKSISKYDDNGNRTAEATYKSDGSLKSEAVHKYDEIGNQKESAYYNYDHDFLGSKSIYKYDTSGNQTEERYMLSDGSLIDKSICKYDESGNVIECATYNSDDTLSSKSTYKYDKSGNVSEETYYTSYDPFNYVPFNKHNKYTYKYEYNSKGQWIKKITFKVRNVVSQAEVIIEREIEYYD